MLWNIRKTVKAAPYLRAYVPEHPGANRHGYVQYHRAVMENHLGRLLRDDEVVHHLDGNPHHNDIGNLVVLNPSDHAAIHARPSHYVELTCKYCGRKFMRRRNQVITKMKYGQRDFYCDRTCMAKHFGRGRVKGNTKKVA